MKHYCKGIHFSGRTGTNEKDIVSKMANYNEVSETTTIINTKVWGEEEVIHNGTHCVKKMTLKPGLQVSMHWHASKEETFILVSGGLIIETLNKYGELCITELTEPLESFTLGINVPHTFYCPEGQKEDTIFIEASTSDRVNDSYRIFPSGPTKTPDNR